MNLELIPVMEETNTENFNKTTWHFIFLNVKIDWKWPELWEFMLNLSAFGHILKISAQHLTQ